MKTPTPPDDVNWAVLLRNAQVVNLDAVRTMKEAYRRLLHFEGPAPIGAFVRLFRLVHLFAFFAMDKKRFPVLNRAWADLTWVMKHPDLDEFAVNSWLILDLPVTDDGRTVAEVFAAEIAPDDTNLRAFVELTRRSRYGIYVDDGGTRQSQRLVELVTRRRLTVMRSVDSERGELIWTRIIDFGGMTFMLGDTRGCGRVAKKAIGQCRRADQNSLGGRGGGGPGSAPTLAPRLIRLTAACDERCIYERAMRSPRIHEPRR